MLTQPDFETVMNVIRDQTLPLSALWAIPRFEVSVRRADLATEIEGELTAFELVKQWRSGQIETFSVLVSVEGPVPMAYCVAYCADGPRELRCSNTADDILHCRTAAKARCPDANAGLRYGEGGGGAVQRRENLYWKEKP